MMSRRNFLNSLLLLAAIGLSDFPALPVTVRETKADTLTSKTSLTVDEIVQRMVERNRERADALRGFQGTRFYRMEYRGFFGSHDAEMTVKLTYSAPDTRQFTVVSQSGSKFMVEHIFRSLLDGEQEAMTPENRRRTALTAENYQFTLVGVEGTQDDPQYVLSVAPKSDNKFLYRGTIWVDGKEFAVTRVEAEPAKSPSFWLKKSKINHNYEKVGDFWLPSTDRSESWIRMGGHAQLFIEYKDYQITDAVSGGLQNAREGALSPSPKTADFLARTPN